MYENVGKKIMFLAQVLGVVYLAAGIIAFIALLAMESIGMAIVALAGGALMAVSSWVLYGFGQLVDDVNDIRNATKDNNTNVISDELPEL